ncbi:MAG: hypothetical protein U0176_08060 [Bacteroidia bacterium]
MSRAPQDYHIHVLLETIHPKWFRHLHWFDEAAERGAPVPESWKALSKKSLPEIIDGIWGGENGHFPEYVAYLKEHLVCLFVGEDRRGWQDGRETTEDKPGIYLYYLIHDEELHRTPLYQQDFFVAGAPTPEAAIAAFEQENGRLPEDSKALLRIHHFMYMINDGLVASIPHVEQLMDSNVRYLGFKTSEDDDMMQYECYGWIGGTQIPYCWVRRPGESDWESDLMSALRFEDECIPRFRFKLRDLLVQHW